MDLNALNVHLMNQVIFDLNDADEEVAAAGHIQVQRAGGPVQLDPFEDLNDEGFVRRYRVTKNLAREIIEIVTPYIVPPSRTSALTIKNKVIAALRFYASGSYQEITGSNIYSNMSQASVSNSIREVTMALNEPEIFNRWVHFPRTLRELEEGRQRFFDKYGFPGIVGLIDCTHVAIVRPTNEDPDHPEHAYVNRKQYHSINVQLICDENLKILNVNSRFPGSVHDARIWRESNVSTAVEQLYRRHPNNILFLLGDSGYPLRPWLITPIQNPAPGSPEERFNNAQLVLCDTYRYLGVSIF